MSEAVGIETAAFLTADVDAVAYTHRCDLTRLERLAVDVRVAGVQSNLLASDRELGRVSGESFPADALGTMVSSDAMSMRSTTRFNARVGAVPDTLRVGQTSLEFGTVGIVETIVQDRLTASVLIVGVTEERVSTNAAGSVVDGVTFRVLCALLGQADIDAFVSFGLVSAHLMNEAVSVDLTIVRHCETR